MAAQQPSSGAVSGEPVQQGEYHVVEQGDCMESIAQEHGYFWQTLWEHPNNAELKAKRQNPDVLLPGDVVYIPEKRLKEEPGATEQRHRFKRKGVPSMLRLVLKDENDEPRVGVPYVLEIDGKLSSGETDSAGRIERPIPPDAQRGKLIVGTGNDQEEHQLQLGHMDPVTEITGVQGRLKNLGYDCGETSGVLDAKTQEAIRAFQAEHGLEVTGEADEATQQELENQHGS